MSATFYFGKLPSRGDFVKSGHGLGVIQQLDTWVGRSLELLVDDVEWKTHYDEAPAVNFLFGGTQARHFIAGRLVASHDLSRRRYPLILGSVVQSDEPLQLLTRAPLVFAETWGHFEVAQRRVLTTDEPAPLLQEIEEMQSRLIPALSAERSALDFAEQHTVDGVESLFRVAGHRLDLRRSVIALGVLLRPMLTQLKPSISRSLILPLPREQPLAAILASIWLELTIPFFARAQLEIGILTTQAEVRPILSVSFSGAHPRALQTAWQPDLASDYLIDIRDADWVDEVLRQDQSLIKLARALHSPALSLARAIRIFRETFIGV